MVATYLLYLVFSYGSLGAVIFIFGHLFAGWIKDLSAHWFGLFAAGFILCIWIVLLSFLIKNTLLESSKGVIFLSLIGLYQFYFMIRNVISGIVSQTGLLSKIICVFWLFGITYVVWFISAYYISCERGPCKRPDLLKSMLTSQAFEVVTFNEDPSLMNLGLGSRS